MITVCSTLEYKAKVGIQEVTAVRHQTIELALADIQNLPHFLQERIWYDRLCEKFKFVTFRNTLIEDDISRIASGKDHFTVRAYLSYLIIDFQAVFLRHNGIEDDKTYSSFHFCKLVYGIFPVNCLDCEIPVLSKRYLYKIPDCIVILCREALHSERQRRYVGIYRVNIVFDTYSQTPFRSKLLLIIKGGWFQISLGDSQGLVREILGQQPNAVEHIMLI
jgi:hypothetical protein